MYALYAHPGPAHRKALWSIGPDSAEEGFGPTVLPRISAALSRFISPISSSIGQGSVRPHKEPESEFKRFENQEKEHPESENPNPESPDQGADEKKTAPPLRLIQGKDTPSGFLEIFKALRSQRFSLVRWLGNRSYQRAQEQSSGPGRLSKGAMLDRKAE